MGYFHRLLIFGLLAELLTIEISKNISGHFLLFSAFIPPHPPSGEKTHHVMKKKDCGL
jgi:hypothetical protein